MKFELPQLPYAINALEPHISQKTMEFHYGKHHQTYVDNLNKLIVGTPFENASLEDVVRKSEAGIYNNAAQVWNHTFFWNCMKPNNRKQPTGKLADALNLHFGSFDIFKEKFTTAAVTLFGSGWAWLVKNDKGELSILPGSNAFNPLTQNLTPLMVVDVWEHAYYLDRQNRRAEFVAAFWELADWETIESRF